MTEQTPKKRKLNEKKFEKEDIVGNDKVVFRLITKANITNLAILCLETKEERSSGVFIAQNYRKYQKSPSRLVFNIKLLI